MTRRSRLRRAAIVRDLIVSIVVAITIVGVINLLISIFESPF
jgi:uncharacterized membrane protein